MGVIGDMSDMFVSIFPLKPMFLQRTKGRGIFTHLLVHQPERDCLIADESLVMALCVRDASLTMAPVDQGMNDIGHVPCVILRMLQEFDPLVRNCHGEAVVKTNAPNMCRNTKKWHPRHIFSNGDDIWEERMQGIVRLKENSTMVHNSHSAGELTSMR